MLAHFDLINNLSESFDVYHCHDTETWPIGYILAKRDGAKFICDSHEFFQITYVKNGMPVISNMN
ncbi:hypothetical protein JTT01_20250 [Clostridium botulinum]|nr:hypothetical protein [Clostridium botulinum]MCS4465885.1 hypothetical protein [Clostridium botulinum]MCS4468423.1 hypothetical protein [Clostridium botulinum]MCS4478491.1 hypothetical protein [Clostridium botulinum]MCS4516302.1 hypothetical protein [Clostridium botulinum]